jgi:hypothetical protein
MTTKKAGDKLSPPSIADIVTEYLKANGYDGLYSEAGECCCSLGDELFPCALVQNCTAGYRVPCHGCYCEYDDGPHYHIGPKKEKHR